MDKIVFIIAHKYFKGYTSYLKYYISNILNFYENPLILVVDNNSLNKNEIFDTIDKNDNIIFIDNQIESKFELGAYQVGINYLIDNKLINEYDYFVFTQDNYIIKNKFDFNTLKINNTHAAPLIGWQNDLAKMDIVKPVLTNLGLFNRLDETNLCWCNSFVLSKDKVIEFYNYIKDIVITVRHQSEGSERYLGRILFELNNGVNFSIDGAINTFISNGVTYDCHSINGYAKIDKYFCKISQQKNENTNEK